jgi:hypothetical protein
LKIPQGVIRISNSKKDRQHNGQKKKAKGQTTIIKTLQWKLDWVTQTQLKTGLLVIFIKLIKIRPFIVQRNQRDWITCVPISYSYSKNYVILWTRSCCIDRQYFPPKGSLIYHFSIRFSPLPPVASRRARVLFTLFVFACA